MTPPKKPDWIEIADNDGGSINRAPKAKKSRPLLVAMAALTLTFGGAVIAQTSQQNSGDAQQPLLVQASQSASAATLATIASPATPSVESGVVPAIAMPPSASGGDEEDDYEENKDDEYDEDDEH
jgi:hypothetical protein